MKKEVQECVIKEQKSPKIQACAFCFLSLAQVYFSCLFLKENACCRKICVRKYLINELKGCKKIMLEFLGHYFHRDFY